MTYFLVTLFLFVVIVIYFRIADKYNIIDKPNHRSSHTSITLRGGGIIFPIAIIVAYFLGYSSLYLTLAVALVAMISFIDDIKPLHQFPRFSSHLIATALVLYDIGVPTDMLWMLAVAGVLFIGWINAFNFMDGINGITVLYSLVSIGTFAYIYQDQSIFQELIIMGLSCVVFGFFNVRKKAKTFAGDVGSISMAVFIGYFIIKLIFESKQIGYLLFLSVYGIDAIVTISYRLRNKENIFEAHRSHLYQYLTNEMKWPHVSVSLLYTALQLVINSITLYFINNNFMSFVTFLIIGASLMLIYCVFRIRVLEIIKTKHV